MKRVSMLLSNAFRPDPRVHKEARSLAQAGYTVTVVCWDRRGEFAPREQLDGFEVRRLAIRSSYRAGSRQLLYLPRFWLNAQQELSALRPHIIHCHDLDTALAGYSYALIHHTPWILDAHECYPEQMRPQVNSIIYRALIVLERLMARRACHIITVGNSLAQRFRHLGGQATIVGNYPALSLTSHPQISRQQVGLREDEFVVAYIGGFTQQRAILPLMAATHIIQQTTVLLVGDGPQRAAIEQALPDHPRVRYVGWVPQETVADYTALADIIYYGLNTNDGNSQYSAPNALFNALAAGKPILTTNAGEIAQIVREEQCGSIIEQPTPMLIAQAIQELSDPSLRERLSAKARQAAQDKYNWAKTEANLLGVYKQMATRYQANGAA